MDSRKLDMFHDGRYEDFPAVGYGVSFHLYCVLQEFIDQYWPAGCYVYGRIYEGGEHCVVVDDFHTPASQDVGRPHHERVAYFPGHCQGFFEDYRCPTFGLGNLKLLYDVLEPFSVLCQVYAVRRSPQDIHSCLFEFPGDIEGCLAAELHDHSKGLFLCIDAEHILHGERFEIELVRGVIVGGDGLGVAVDHDRFVSFIPQREGRMDARVVELDTLADSVRPPAQDHDFGPAGDLDLVGCVVGGVIVDGIGAAYRHRAPGLCFAQCEALIPDLLLLDPEEATQVFVRESFFLGLHEEVTGKGSSFEGEDLLLPLHQLFHLLDKPSLYAGDLVKLVHGSPFPQGFVHDELPFRTGLRQKGEEFVQRKLVEVFGKAEAVAFYLQRADGLLKGLLVILTNAHNLAHGLHLRSELVFGFPEFLEGPPRKLDDHVISRGRILIEGPVTPVRYVSESLPAGKLGRDEGYRESCGL